MCESYTKDELQNVISFGSPSILSYEKILKNDNYITHLHVKSSYDNEFISQGSWFDSTINKYSKDVVDKKIRSSMEQNIKISSNHLQQWYYFIQLINSVDIMKEEFYE